MDNLIGQVLDNRYSIREIVGTGGMSVVYKAEDSLADRFVAIKVLKDDLLKDQVSRRRFLNESRAIAMLSHENIVDVLDVNFDGDTQYIVMEFLEGITLKEYLRIKGALSVEEALGYTEKILQALRHAHERGVVHRDIKPQNIMLLSDGNIKVTDFGIAHVSDSETITMTETAIGSVHYISPEQAKGLPSDEKSDVYSAGIMLYEMVTGKLPFEADSAVSVALMQVEQEAVRPSEIVATLPVGIEQIIIRSMQKNVKYRYQSADEMLKDIERYNENNAIVFNHLKPRPVSAEDFGDEEMSAKKKSSAKAVRRRRSIITAVVGAVLGALIAIIFSILAFVVYPNSVGDKRIQVPVLTGRDINDVLVDSDVIDNFEIVQEKKYSTTVPAGEIIQQSPARGSVEKGSKITVVVSLGDETTIVPQLIGQTRIAAQKAIKEAKLLYKIEMVERNDKEPGIVIDCAPSEGEQVAVETVITLYVSQKTEENTVIMVNLVGKTEDVATALLSANDLGYEIVYQNSTQPQGFVISQSPEEGSAVKKYSIVTLYVSTGVPPTTGGGEEDPGTDTPVDPENPETPDPEMPDPEIPDPEVPNPDPEGNGENN